jgi:hypothetical protein
MDQSKSLALEDLIRRNANALLHTSQEQLQKAVKVRLLLNDIANMKPRNTITVIVVSLRFQTLQDTCWDITNNHGNNGANFGWVSLQN